MLIEDVEDCPPVECWMWQKIAVSCGYFEGIRKLSFADLLELRSLCDHQMQRVVGRAETESCQHD